MLVHEDMLVRYCAEHLRYFGYPRPLAVRWNGWTLSTVSGLCEACRVRERREWEAAPYGDVLIPAPVELGPRTLGRRALAASIAGAAAVVTTMALLVATPSDLIPSGGGPELLSTGARLAGPVPAQADTRTERPAASRPNRRGTMALHGVASRVAHGRGLSAGQADVSRDTRETGAVARSAISPSALVAPAVFLSRPGPPALVAIQSP